jgi:3-deoxy-D-manno-octulosonic-acid transferase
MRKIYTILLYFIIPFILLRLYWKGRRLPAYRRRIKERFAQAKLKGPVDIWLHAVSLGEVVAAAPLIDALLAKNYKIIVTTMTPTGSQEVLRRFVHQVQHQYVPYDLPWVLKRFFKKVNPRLCIMMETELWPNTIAYTHQLNIPCFIINARISSSAFQRYQKVRFLFKPIISQLTAIFAQSEDDAERFKALGALESRVEVLGNLKFDINIQSTTNTECKALKVLWGEARPVFIAASTHENEEEQLLSQLKALQREIPDVLMLVVPRHPERFQAVYLLCNEYRFITALRSQPQTIQPICEIVVIDSIGELLHFYQLSDYAFVGGSLVPIGGHNVLEPIAVNVPVLCGPFMNNSKAICLELAQKGALKMAKDSNELIKMVSDLHHDPKTRQQQMISATAVLHAHKGAVAKYLERIELQLAKDS